MKLQFKTQAGLDKYIADLELTNLYNFVKNHAKNIPMDIKILAKEVYKLDTLTKDDIDDINIDVKKLNNISLSNGHKFIDIFDYQLIILNNELIN